MRRVPWLRIVGVVLAIVGASVGVYLNRPKDTPKNEPTTSTAVPYATRPPLGLSGLKYLPTSNTLLLAVQPSPLLQYCQRTKTKPEDVLPGLGLPAGIWDTERSLGLNSDALDHMLISLGDSILPQVAMVLIFRERTPDLSTFSKKLEQRALPDQPGRSQVSFGGLPMLMQRINEQTVALASTKELLESMLQTRPAGTTPLSPDLRDAMTRLSPASFLWLASNSQDWSQSQQFQVVARLGGLDDLPAKLKGIQAFALGYSIEPDLRLTVGFRVPEAKTREAYPQRGENALKPSSVESDTADDWVRWQLKCEPDQRVDRILKKLLDAK
jgi:hypothetical protein